MTPNRPDEESLFIPGPAGRLEALLRAADAPRAAVLICHPHPLHGGSMHNKILHRIALRAASEHSISALRFNFRGTERSEGVHDEGRGEVGDTQAALDWLAARFPEMPLSLVGYSFGAAVGLAAASTHHRVECAVGLGLPLGLEFDLSYLERFRKPLLLVHGDEDEFASGAEIEAFAARNPHEPKVRRIPATGHLFAGREDEAVDAVVSYLARATSA